MENAEEVMQLLEEFSKIRPKEIPRELEDYLGYVAKTGDPVYQWSLVKNLFREKLLIVITDFYESTLTVELPPCPNVEPFNYERMKTSLLERFDTFSSAPFTVQRICELLTNPRKEYNRADKYMRAIEKNILVVSTREPGSAKRPYECDNQTETVLNGIPDVKVNESDGSLLHVPTDLPYLGAPPASNDVTVETTEHNVTINDRTGLDMNGEPKSVKTDTGSDKSWATQESVHVLSQESEQDNTQSKTLNPDDSLTRSTEEKDCDINNRLGLTGVDSVSPNLSSADFVGEGTSDDFTQNNEALLPDSIDSSESSQECSEIVPHSKIETDEVARNSDENEVSSTPANSTADIALVQQEVEEPTNSEAEATDISAAIIEEAESSLNLSPDSEINSSDRIFLEEAKSVTISEITPTKEVEVALECNEITGTVVSPISPENSSVSLQTADPVHQNITESGTSNVLEENDQPDLHPDSSNDVGLQLENKPTSLELHKPESCIEADSMSETHVEQKPAENDFIGVEDAPDQSDNDIPGHIDSIALVSSPTDQIKLSEEKSLENIQEGEVLSSTLPEESIVSEGESSNSVGLIEDKVKLSEVQSTREVSEEMYDHERREESVIQPLPNVTPNVTPDSQQPILTIEEISVDPSCEAEEEAMDIDDGSNQMMVSEGENEGEPMDQCDQLQS